MFLYTFLFLYKHTPLLVYIYNTMAHIPCEHEEIAYIYLLQDGNDRGTDIYKIGRTSDKCQDTRTLKRLKSYSKNTIVYNLTAVSHCEVVKIENDIKSHFNKKYILVRGQEWFKGNVNEMKKDINKIIDDYIIPCDINNLLTYNCSTCKDTGIEDKCDDLCCDCDISWLLIGPNNTPIKDELRTQWAYIFDYLKWNWEYVPEYTTRTGPMFILSFDNNKVLTYINEFRDIPYSIKVIYESGWKGDYLILSYDYKFCRFFDKNGNKLNCTSIKIGTCGNVYGFSSLIPKRSDILNIQGIDEQMNFWKNKYKEKFEYDKFQPVACEAFLKCFDGQWFIECTQTNIDNCVYKALGTSKVIHKYYKSNSNGYLQYRFLTYDKDKISRGATDVKHTTLFHNFWKTAESTTNDNYNNKHDIFTRDIQAAVNFLGTNSSTLNYNSFKEQLNHFNKDFKSPLKDYLDFIQRDALSWLKALPNHIKDKETFIQYITPLHVLLNNKHIQNAYGKTYCNTLNQQIWQVFINNIKLILYERQENITCTHTHTDNSDDDNSSLDIDSLEYENPKNRVKTDDDYNKKIQYLEVRLQDEERKVFALQTSVHHLTQEKNNLWEQNKQLINKLAHK